MVTILAGDTRVRITHHALERMELARRHGFAVTQELTIDVLLHPYQVVIEEGKRDIAQSPIDDTHLLRVAYETENEGTDDEAIVLVTVHIGGRSRYEI